ncbi:hypothetical protein ACFWZ2_32135 [Streptomyces sp. NPDC059002]|uniref:hypothetical protein n=1 Tax=Streptomyces sp. NPDC059002 TaxID=3346690 RepID=UPI00369074E1
MRPSPAAVLAALALLVVAPSGVPQERAHARVAAEPRPRPFGAECRTGVEGSRVVAECHNPYPETDRVRLHVECDRWWDIDLDSAPVDAGPAQTVRLTGRCWKEVRSVWVSHQK